jgi:hypothetical protein
MGGPGPVIDFLNECVRWWDKWLKGIDSGVQDDPMIRAWMKDTVSPISDRRPGRWVGEKEWPASDISEKRLNLLYGELGPEDGEQSLAVLSIQSPLSVGLFAGKWCSYSETTDLPSDQREEDGGSLIFDTLPLEKDLEILGSPRLEVELSSNKPVATIAARISDVAPNGRATRVTYGVLNLTHRNSHEKPEELEEGRKYRITLEMNDVAQKFPAGNQLRLSVSSSYWPLAWPSPEPARLKIFLENSRLLLPEREPKPSDELLRDLGRPGEGRKLSTTLLVPSHREWEVKHNLATNEVLLHVTNNDPTYRLDDINWTVQKDVTEKYFYKNNNYDTLRGEVTSKRLFRRDEWEVYTLTRTILTSSRTHFRIRATLDAYEEDTRIFSKTWDETIPRDLL